VIPSGAKARVYVGTSGWSYPDWEGVVYPRRRAGSRGDLAYVAEFLDAVEINTTFYRPPRPAYCAKWVRDVSERPDFLFTLKLWRRFTHEREAPWQPGDVRAFREAIRPLTEAGRVGAALMQFPWAFPRTQEHEDWIRRLAEAFADLPLVVEVRHVSWGGPEGAEFFRNAGLNFCNIDQPTSRQSVGRTNVHTGEVAYYRFHGRNAAKWFDRRAGRDARYDYLYSEAELAPWVKRITEMAERVGRIFVMTNNHYRGQSFVNALQVRSALLHRPVPVPAELREHYPVLNRIAAPAGGAESLFPAE